MGYKAFGIQTSLNSIWTDASLSPLSGSYDQTKTNLVNRIQNRLPAGATISGVGISPVNFLSTQDLSGTPNPVAHGYTVEPTYPNMVQKVFIPLTPAAAIIPVAYFQYNIQTDVWTYIGKMQFTMPTSTVHTVKSIAVDDNSGGTTGWSVHFLTTNATAANGGYFYSPNINASDFTVGGGTVIPAATTGNTQASKVVFWMQETGGTNNLQTGVGIAFDAASKIIYLSHLTASTIFYKFTYNSTISTTTAAGVVVDCFNFKTGAYAGFGTILATNNMKLAIPKSSQSGALIGNKCIYLSSATFGFHFLVTDLSNGSTTAPSFVTWNKLGTSVDYVTLTWSQACWSNVLDVEFNYSASGRYMMKRSINNDSAMQVWGTNDAIYAEVAGTKHPMNFAGTALVGMFEGSGVLYATSSTVGQRGIYAQTVAADQYFTRTYTGVVGPSYVITPVVSVNCAQAIAKGIIAEYRYGGGIPVIDFRTSNYGSFSLSDTWTTLPANNNLQTVGGLSNISGAQLRITFRNIGDYETNSYLINEIIMAYIGKLDTSDSWVLRLDNFSLNGSSPVQTAAKQVAAYSGGAKTIYVNYYDSSLNLIKQRNTTTNYTEFYKSTDGGATFTVMGSANDYTNSGAGTTVIQHRDPSPASGINRVAYRDVSY
jgi:hypothetical protein